MQEVDWLSPIRGLIEFVAAVLNIVPVFRAILGFVLVFLLPGFAWTLVFFKSHQINLIERLALSFGLSIALVTLSILGLNVVLGVRVTGLNAVLIILTITVIPALIYCLKWIVRRHGQNVA